MSKALLAVSFGTSFPETRHRTIDAIEETLAAAFPDRRLYRAWTSKRILKKLRERDGVCFDDLEQALARMAADGVTDLLVQPTFLLTGTETKLTRKTLAEWRGRFDAVALGEPLLTCGADVEELARALEERYGAIGEREMLALMGHGSEEAEFEPYVLLGAVFARDGYEHFKVGTVEFAPGFAPVLQAVRERHPARVTLAPLMVVAGDHANNDMAGDDEDSWKSMLEREGVQVECVLEGLGEIAGVRELYVRRAAKAAPI